MKIQTLRGLHLFKYVLFISHTITRAAGLTDSVRGPAEVSSGTEDESDSLAIIIKNCGLQQKLSDTVLIPIQEVHFCMCTSVGGEVRVSCRALPPGAGADLVNYVKTDVLSVLLDFDEKHYVQRKEKKSAEPAQMPMHRDSLRCHYRKANNKSPSTVLTQRKKNILYSIRLT